jgi:hypothetical protein
MERGVCAVASAVVVLWMYLHVEESCAAQPRLKAAARLEDLRLSAFYIKLL